MWGVEKQRATKTIKDEESGLYVTIQKLTQGDRDDIQDLLASMNIAGKSDAEIKQLANINLGKMRALQRSRSVIKWNIPELDENGKPTGIEAAINELSLRSISAELADAIDDAIDELNPERLSDNKKKK